MIILPLLFFTAIHPAPGNTGTVEAPSYIIKRELFRTTLSCLHISPDGSLLLAGFQDGSFALLDPSTFQPILEVSRAHLKAVNAMDMPPGMDFVLTAGGNSIFLWDLSGNKVATWAGHATTIWDAEISSNGQFAVSSAFNKTFLLWDVPGNILLEKMQGHEDVALTVSISPDSRRIASGSSDRTIRIWNAAAKKEIMTLHGPDDEIYDLAFSPDSRRIAVASRDRTIRVYDLEEGNMAHLLKGHRDMVMEVEFSPDGRYLVSGSADHSLILWDARTGDQVHAYLDNEEAILDVAFHPDGHSFYSISFAGDLTRWALDPEIFVLRYFEDRYLEEMAVDPLFEPRRPGESRKDFEARELEAAEKKEVILQKYYGLYLEQQVQQAH